MPYVDKAMLTAHRVRTSFALAGAAGTIIAALLLHGNAAPPEPFDGWADDGIRLEARLISTKILPGPMDHDLAVTITAPGRDLEARPPLSLVVVVDRSGSMQGEPLRNAKAAAGRLINQLDERDAFSVVTYSSGDETVVPMSRATPDAKRRALYGLETIVDEGGTCISCGITRGTTELARSPITGGVRRIVLISDGQANEGIGVPDRSELVQFAHDTAAGGISISAVGVGLDFDEVTMQRIANVGRGNYYFVEDTGKLDAMFAAELGGLAHTFATQVQLVLRDAPGARIVEAYGYPSRRAGDSVTIPISDLRAGETRKVVLRVQVAPTATGPMTITRVGLSWHRASDNHQGSAGTSTVVDVVDDPADVAASVHAPTVQAVEAALGARALEEANEVYDTHGAAAAQQVLELRDRKLRANKYLDAVQRGRLSRDNANALDNLRRVPAAKAKKDNAAKAYELAH
jgi:Ca-activated chloride channel homolog